MELCAGIDLHANNSVVVVLDANDRVVFRKRLPNDLGMIVEALRFCGSINAVAVESTFNWCWLGNGLQNAGHEALGLGLVRILCRIYTFICISRQRGPHHASRKMGQQPGGSNSGRRG